MNFERAFELLDSYCIGSFITDVVHKAVGLDAKPEPMPGLKEPLIGEDQTKAKAKWQKLVFLITFLNYAMAHFSRKCYTNVKTDLMASGVDKIILSQMDTAFMFTYAIGSFISGRLGDTFPQNVVIGVGLLGSTLCTAAPSEMVTVAMSRTAGRLAPGRHAWVPGRSPHVRLPACGGRWRRRAREGRRAA